MRGSIARHAVRGLFLVLSLGGTVYAQEGGFTETVTTSQVAGNTASVTTTQATGDTTSVTTTPEAGDTTTVTTTVSSEVTETPAVPDTPGESGTLTGTIVETNGDDDHDGNGCNAAPCAACVGFTLLLPLIWIITAVLLAWWMYRDATRRGNPQPALWAVVGLILHLVGLIIYLVMRGNRPGSPGGPMSSPPPPVDYIPPPPPAV